MEIINFVQEVASTSAYYETQLQGEAPTRRPVTIEEVEGEHLSEERNMTDEEVATWTTVDRRLPKYKYNFTEVKKCPKLKGSQ